MNSSLRSRLLWAPFLGCMMIGFKVYEFNNIREEIELMKQRGMYDENVRLTKRYSAHERNERFLKRVMNKTAIETNVDDEQ